MSSGNTVRVHVVFARQYDPTVVGPAEVVDWTGDVVEYLQESGPEDWKVLSFRRDLVQEHQTGELKEHHLVMARVRELLNNLQGFEAYRRKQLLALAEAVLVNSEPSANTDLHLLRGFFDDAGFPLAEWSYQVGSRRDGRTFGAPCIRTQFYFDLEYRLRSCVMW